jgi:activator of HSP90 ATPase
MKNSIEPEVSPEEMKELNAIVRVMKLIMKVGGVFQAFRIVLIRTHGKPFVTQTARTKRAEELLDAVTAQNMSAPYSWGTYLPDGKDEADEAQ